MTWWIPLAFLAAVAAGAAIALGLLAVSRSGESTAPEGEHEERPRRSRYAEDNELVWNPGPLFALAGLAAVLTVLALVISLS